MRAALHVRVEGAQAVSEAAMVRAARVLQLLHPPLQCSVRSGDGDPTVLEAVCDPALRIPVVVCDPPPHLSEDAALDAVWAKWERQPYVLGDPLARVLLLRHGCSADGTTAATDVVLVCEHAFCDGVSLGHAMHVLLNGLALADGAADSAAGAGAGAGAGGAVATSAAAGVPLTASADADTTSTPPWPPSLEALALHCTGVLQQLADEAATATLRLRMWRARRRPTPTLHVPCSTAIAPGTRADVCRTATMRTFLTPADTAALLSACRRRAVTVTAAATSALLQACSECITAASGDCLEADRHPLPGAVSCGFAVDLRRHSGTAVPGTSLSYMVAATPSYVAPPSVAAGSGASALWQSASLVRADVLQALRRGLPRKVALMLGHAYKSMLRTDPPVASASTVSVSSWGVLPLRGSYGGFRVARAAPIVNLNIAPAPVCFLSTTAGVLCVSVAAPTPMFEHALLHTLASRTAELLRAMVQ